jgi:DNA-binding IscR family transcriptional regulator
VRARQPFAYAFSDYLAGGIAIRTATRFAIAIHIMSLIGSDMGREMTSEWIANSVGVNPVIVRNVTGMLRRAGLVRTHRGVAGARPARPLSEINLLELFKAVELESEIFSIHPRPSADCAVGSHIKSALTRAFGDAQMAMEDRLAKITMEDVLRDVRSTRHS